MPSRSPQPAQDARTSRVARVVLVVATIATVAIGSWGFSSRGGGPTEAAAPGESVEVPGGTLRVERVTTNVGSHAMAGMAGMAGETRKGFRRINVEISLSGRSADGLRYPAERFSLRGRGMRAVVPVSSQLGSEVLGRGMAATGRLTFEVPEGATGLQLLFEGAERPLSLNAANGRRGDHEQPKAEGGH